MGLWQKLAVPSGELYRDIQVYVGDVGFFRIIVGILHCNNGELEN